MKIFLSLFLLFGAARSAQAIDVGDFIGHYRLLQARYGMLCPDQMQAFINGGFTGTVELDLGSWIFPRVNEGKVEFTDSMSHRVSESFTRGNKIIYRSKDYTPVIRQTLDEVTEASLSGNLLHAVSRTHSHSPGDPEGVRTYTDCTFRKLAEAGGSGDTGPAFPGDGGNAGGQGK